jgi:hypothetical protein
MKRWISKDAAPHEADDPEQDGMGESFTNSERHIQ